MIIRKLSRWNDLDDDEREELLNVVTGNGSADEADTSGHGNNQPMSLTKKRHRRERKTGEKRNEIKS